MKERIGLFSKRLIITPEEMQIIREDGVMKIDADKFRQLPDGGFELKAPWLSGNLGLISMYKDGLELSKQFGKECKNVFSLQRDFEIAEGTT